MDNRPSIWGIGLSAGLFTAGVLLLVAVLRQQSFALSWLAIGASIVVTWWFGLPVLVWMVTAGWAAFKELHAWKHRNDKLLPPTPPAPAAPAAVVLRYASGIVNGRPREPLEIKAEPRSARWTAWQLGAENWIEWYKQLRATTSGAMVGKYRAFKDNTGWQAFTDELGRVELVDKSNGRRAVIIGTAELVEARIRSGEIDWREDEDPPKVAAPTLPPTTVPVTIGGALA